MISKQLNDAIACIAQLTQSEQERLIAFMQSPPSVMSEPAKATPKQSLVSSSNRWHRHWTDEEHLLLMQHIEDEPAMSRAESKRKRRQIAKQLGRTVCAVNRKIQKLQGKK
jgi:hypothetical protein